MALILRLLEADSRGIWQDEGLTLYQVRLSFAEIFANRIPVAHFITQNTVPPLYVLLLAGWAQLLGYTLWSLRLFSVFCSLLVLLLFYRVGTSLDGARSGRIAALLAAISPIYLWYAQELRMYTFLLLPATLSFGLLWLWYRQWEEQEDSHGGQRVSSQKVGATRPLGFPKPQGSFPRNIEQVRQRVVWLLALAYALTAGAMAWTHYLAFLLIGAQLLWLGVVLLRRYPKLLAATWATLLLIALPLIPFGLRRLFAGEERDFYFRSLQTIVNDALHALSFGMPYFVSSYEDVYFLFALAWLLLGLGLWQAWRRGGWALLGLLGGGLVLPVLALYLLSYIKPIYQNVRHLFMISPAFYLLWALGLSRLAEIRRWLALLAISLLTYSWLLSTLHYFDPSVDRLPLKNDVRPLFEMIAKLYVPGDVVALNDPVLQHAFEYFAPDIPWTVLPPYAERNPEAKVQAYEATAQQYDRLWYVLGPPDTTFDTWKEPRKWFDEHYSRLSYDVLLGHTIVGALLYDTQGNNITRKEPQAAAVPAEVDFGKSLRFLGLYKPLPAEAIPAKQRLVVETLWTAPEQPSEELQFVLQLTDGRGRIWHQEQLIPFGGYHLTSHWLRQQYLRLPLFFTPPASLPPARYNLLLYLVNAAGQSLYPNGEGQALSLGTLSITRENPPPMYLRDRSDQLTGPLIGGRLRLQADALPQQLPPAPRLPLRLQIEVMDEGAFPDTFELHLISQEAQGQSMSPGTREWHQSLTLSDGLPSDANGVPQFPPSQWLPGDLFTLRYELQLPADLAGQFEVELTAKAPPEGRGKGEKPLAVPRWWGLGGNSTVALGELYIEPRTPRTEIPPYDNPVGAEWAETVRLLGYQSTPAGIFSKANAEPLHLQLVWQAIAPPERPYKVFLHLLDEQGAFITGADAFFDAPSLAWEAEEIILTQHTFDITALPAGKYTLLVGLYHEASQERLPIEAPNFAWPMGILEIEE